MSTGRPLRLVSSHVELPENPRRRAEAMLRTMARHVEASLADERFIAHARAVTSDGGRSTAPVVRVRLALKAAQQLGYVWDPIGRERMQEPLASTVLGWADCNSNIVYFAGLTCAVGIPTRFIVIRTDEDSPDYGHVYALVQLEDGDWYTADPSPLGQGRRATYLPLGRQAMEPIDPIILDAADPNGAMHGIFDSIKDVFEGAWDVVRLKPLRKALRYGWAHAGKDLRKLVMTVGPMVAGMYGGPLGADAAKIALGLLENDRLSKAEKKARKKWLAEAIADAEARGLIAKGVIDVKNPEHVAAIAMAGQLPPEVQAEWYRQHGLAPPLAAQHGPDLSSALAVGAGAALLFASWPLALALGAGAVIAHHQEAA